MGKGLLEAKKQSLMMEQKCHNIHQLRNKVHEKKTKMKAIILKNGKGYFLPPLSLQTFLRLMGVQEHRILDPSQCKK